MKRKGFTLIELLAVIVIISVIGLITIPMIGNIIGDSKKKALEQSVYGIVEAANYFALDNTEEYHFIFGENNKVESTTGKSLSYKGFVDANGDLYIDNDGNISLCLMNDTYYAYKNYNSGIYIGNVKEDTCIIGYDALTNKYVAMLDDGTGQVSNVYSKEEVDTLVSNLQEQINLNTQNIELLNTLINDNKNNIDSNIESITNLQNTLSNYSLQSELDITNENVTANTDNIMKLQKGNTLIGGNYIYSFNTNSDRNVILTINSSYLNHLKINTFGDVNNYPFNFWINTEETIRLGSMGSVAYDLDNNRMILCLTAWSIGTIISNASLTITYDSNDYSSLITKNKIVSLTSV